MAELAKPIEKPRWATGGAAIISSPSSSKQDTGFTTDTGTISGVPEKPPLQNFNWLHKRIYEWINYFESESDLVLGAQPVANLIIASDAITPTRAVHWIDTEGGAATDELRNISTANFDEGRLLLIRSVTGSRDITVKNAAGGLGQINLAHAVDVVLDDSNKWLMLSRSGADWIEVLRSWPEAEKVRTQDLDARGALPLNIGSGLASAVNIGRPGIPINLFGSVIEIETINSQIVDALVRFNFGGAAGSASNAGFEIEENSIVTGYFKTSDGSSGMTPSRAGYVQKAPARSGLRMYRCPNVGNTEGMLSADLSFTSVTILAGETLTHPFLNIPSGQVYDGDGNLFVPGGVQGAGTVSITGNLIS